MPQVIYKKPRQVRYRLKKHHFHAGSIIFALAVFFSAAYITALTSQPASALGSTGPDPADFRKSSDNKVQRRVVFQVDNTSFVGAQSTQILTYFSSQGTRSQPNKIVVYSAGLTDPGTYDQVYSGDAINNSEIVTKYSLASASGGTLSGVTVCNAQKDRVSCTFLFWMSGASIDIGTQTYIVQLQALLIPIPKRRGATNPPTFQNGFYVTAEDSNAVASNKAIVGFDSSQDSTKFAMTEQLNDNDYTDWNLRFGADCSVLPSVGGKPGGKDATFIWYDPDNGTPRVQPKKMTFEIFDDGLIGTNRVPKLVRLFGLNGNSGDNDSTATISGKTVTPGSGSKTTGSIKFHAESAHKYRVKFYNVWSNNTLQFQIPFNSVYYLKNNCNLLPSSSFKAIPSIKLLDTTSLPDGRQYVASGTTIRVYYIIDNFGAARNLYRTVTAYSGTGPAGTASASGFPPSFTARPVTYLTSGTHSADNPIYTKIIGKEGSSICFTHTVNPSDEAHDTAISVPACVYVFAATGPIVATTGSDVHAGASICGLPNITGGISTNNGSYGEYIVASSGNISNFTSNGPLGDSHASVSGYTSVCRPDLVSEAGLRHGTVDSSSPFLDLSRVAPTSGVLRLNGDVSIHGDVSSKLTIVTTGKVTIDGDIIVNGGKGDRAHIPSLGIIAGSGIDILGRVNRVDAYLFTNGLIDTCHEQQLVLCSKKLTVNGFLMGKSVKLNRTGIADNPFSISPVGEQINMTGQLYVNPPSLFDLPGSFNFLQLLGERPPLN